MPLDTQLPSNDAGGQCNQAWTTRTFFDFLFVFLFLGAACMQSRKNRDKTQTLRISTPSFSLLLHSYLELLVTFGLFTAP